MLTSPRFRAFATSGRELIDQRANTPLPRTGGAGRCLLTFEWTVGDRPGQLAATTDNLDFAH